MAKTPLTQDAVKVVLGGHLGAQTWSIGIYCVAAGASNATSADCIVDATALNTAATTWANVMRTFWSSGTQYDNIKVYAYAAGSLTSHANGQLLLATPIVGSGSGAPLPAYTAICHTLLSASSGASNRGRVYPPMTNANLSPTNFQITTANTTTMATALAAMLTSWNSVSTAVITNHVPTVASFSTGTEHPIEQVRVDTMPDTQHRREDNIAVVGASAHTV